MRVERLLSCLFAALTIGASASTMSRAQETEPSASPTRAGTEMALAFSAVPVADVDGYDRRGDPIATDVTGQEIGVVATFSTRGRSLSAGALFRASWTLGAPTADPHTFLDVGGAFRFFWPVGLSELSFEFNPGVTFDLVPDAQSGSNGVGLHIAISPGVHFPVGRSWAPFVQAGFIYRWIAYRGDGLSSSEAHDTVSLGLLVQAGVSYGL